MPKPDLAHVHDARALALLATLAEGYATLGEVYSPADRDRILAAVLRARTVATLMHAGRVLVLELEECPACGGAGVESCAACGPDAALRCPTCAGRGDAGPCQSCAGAR